METSDAPLELWLALIAIISITLSIDLFSDHFHKIFKLKKPLTQKREYPFGTDVLWTIIWLSLGGLFALVIYLSMGYQKAIEYATGYALEKSLSVDNMLVFVLIFTSLGISHVYQHRVLMWGIIGAIAMRIVFILAGISLLETFSWMIYVLGGILLFTSFRIISKKDNKKLDIEKSLVVKILRKFTSIDTTSHDHKFIKVIGGKMIVTPLLVALLSVEMADFVFALDSIPAILSITQDSFIVISSNIFAILGLRSLYFLIGSGIEKLHYLKYGLTVLLAFIGVKMIISEFVHIEIIPSLIVVFAILGITFIASIFKAKKST
jgi:TerC family integral membrane protein